MTFARLRQTCQASCWNAWRIVLHDLERRRLPRKRAGGGRKREVSCRRADAWVAAQPESRWERIEVRPGEKEPLLVDAMSVRVRAKQDDRVGHEERLVVIRIRPAGESRIYRWHKATGGFSPRRPGPNTSAVAEDCAIEPKDAFDVLEEHVNEPEFSGRWRAFVRTCSLSLSDLPGEAREWIAAADEYEQGRLNADDLTTVRVRAWRFHDARRAAATPVELAALQAVMLRLWPDHDPVHWCESAWHFLDNCETAGLTESRWRPILRAQFPAILDAGEHA